MSVNPAGVPMAEAGEQADHELQNSLTHPLAILKVKPFFPAGTCEYYHRQQMF